MADTKIEWTDKTWNPITGCSRVSAGCVHCYAERFAHRFSGAGQRYEGLTQIVNGHPAWTGVIQFNEKKLLEPLSWKSPKRVFVNSMSDLFHENVTDEMRDRIFAVMALTPRHSYQILTKRPERMLTYLSLHTSRALIYMKAVEIASKLEIPRPEMVEMPLHNVWLGTSVEDQKNANERIPFLLETPAAVKFLSCEPLLGPIDFKQVPGFNRIGLSLYNWWVICGGESGPGARPMNPDWARSIRDQCKNAGVPFFFKQWGEWVPRDMALDIIGDDAVSKAKRGSYASLEGHFIHKVGKRKAGDLLDGVQYHEYPKV